jgi:hypothetical protein
MWAQTHGASTTTDTHGGTILHAMQVQQLAAMQAARPDNSLNVGLTDCVAITSPSSPTPPHASTAPRHSSTVYDAHKLRLRLGHRKLGEVLGQTETNANYSEKKPSVPK